MNKVKYSHKVIAFFLALNIMQSVLPYNLLYASNNGPSAPEAQGFESVNATDMVNLATGDMSYVLPLMDVGGLPISLSYHGGVPLDLESTWTGLGWNLNTGAINRGLNAAPDDWNGGTSIDFIRYEESETIYNVNVGIGITSAFDVGVGASWGSNKSLSGSVFASIGVKSMSGESGLGASASIDTNGNYSLGVSAGTGKDGGASFGGGVGVSGNVGGGSPNVSVGAGLRSSNGLTVGLGTSLTSGGISASLGYNNGKGGSKTVSGAGSLSMGSFSQGDWEIDSKGWYIPIQIKLITFGFGKQKVTYNLSKGYKKIGYGSLYSNNVVENSTNTGDLQPFSDYQNRYRNGDAYDQALPVPEREFVGDYDSEREKLNFTFVGYDSYDVNASGISGIMQPRILQNSTAIGLGYQGSDPYNELGTAQNPGKMRVFYHNTYATQKTFGTSSNISTNNVNSDIEFYFNGQFTQNTIINSLEPSNSETANSLQGLLTTRPSLNNERLKQGNYIEVYTNSQIKNGYANGLLSPLNPTSNGLTNQALERISPEYVDSGIGAYKITAPDGKVYHFSQPVYHYEMVQRNYIKDNSGNNVNEKRQYSPYATHWLLTAITGPDFIDTNNNNIADSSDYGYWVRMDYGKWSDGYVWRNPTDKNLKDYSTNIAQNIQQDDFGYYQYGRKQLFYLDRVVSATHTAYFVKDLRYDSSGCDLSYSFQNSDINTNEGTGGQQGFNPYESGFEYKKQLQLMLEKIVLVKNSNAIVSKGDFNNNLALNVNGLTNYSDKTYTIDFSNQGGFYNVYGDPNILINNESGVYDVKDFENFDYSNAVNVIDLEYNYNLAVKDHTNTNNDITKSNGSPGAVYNAVKNPNNGKLCLKSVRFLGRNNYDYMPPYQFEYKGEYKGSNSNYIKYPVNAIIKKQSYSFGGINWQGNTISSVSTNQNGIVTQQIPIVDARAKDEWGFLKDIEGQESQVMAAAWTMTQIKTPTGAFIDFEHEEDDFYTEAFSRRYWTEGLQFSFSNLTPYNFNNPSANANRTFDITIKKNEVETLLPNFDMRDYFIQNEPIFFDFWICVIDRDYNWGCNADREKVDIRSQGLIPFYVDEDEVVFRLKKTDYIPELDDTGDLFGHTFRLDSNEGSEHPYLGSVRDDCPPQGDNCGPDGFYLKYKILANRSPKKDSGGGLRVKSITLNDEFGNSYKTNYYYNKPGTNKIKNVGSYVSSGITSYSPVKGQKFVPYQSELPSPGVMYEYVTMVAEGQNGDNLGETRYRFYTLKPVLDIFNENIEMKDEDGTTIFKATVTNYADQNGFLNENKKVLANKIKLDVNTSLIGQFRSVEEFNKAGQLMSKTEKKYLSGYALKDENINRGSLTESFQSMKSIYKTDADGNNVTLKKRLLSLSSREEFGSVLKTVTTTGMHGKSTETYSKTDPETGAFMVVETEKANGSKQRVERVPAYRKYPELGSKVVNPTNKNMLTQETMSVTSILKDGLLKTQQGTIATWNKNWTYRDNFGAESSPTAENQKIWRKHKTFVLNNAIVNAESSNFNFATDNVRFNWTTATPIDNYWKKVSEITRYNHFSVPLESKDINNNFASSKMADNNTKVIVSGNARYTEMYYTGAEYVAGNNYFEGEVLGADYRTNEVAHTGLYSVKSESPLDKVFQVVGTSGSENYYSNPDNYTATFRPGKYKVSFWTLDENDPAKGTKLFWNGQEIRVEETVVAGCWKQLNYYVDLDKDSSHSLYIINDLATQTAPYYYDDFRMHPVASSISSYVYDHNTDELSFMLDGNNMASAFVYDPAGRLRATYVETENAPTLAGGFKIVSQNSQNYKNGVINAFEALPTINNCRLTGHERMEVQIMDTELATFQNNFKSTVSGGSSNYSYQYKWIKNVDTKEFTNYVSGSANQLIPYALKNCGSGRYDKVWSFVVKITDLNTGKITEQPYEYSTADCQFTVGNGSDIQVSKVNSLCGSNTYSFTIHQKDISKSGNFVYEYAYYDSQLSFDQQNFINVTSSNGKFCPNWSRVADINCASGYRDYVNIAYRVTNLTTGEVSKNIIMFMGDASSSQSTSPIVSLPSLGRDHLGEGNIIKLSERGDVEEVYNVNRITK